MALHLRLGIASESESLLVENKFDLVHFCDTIEFMKKIKENAGLLTVVLTALILAVTFFALLDKRFARMEQNFKQDIQSFKQDLQVDIQALRKDIRVIQQALIKRKPAGYTDDHP